MRKYGVLGIFLLIIAIISILSGIYITYAFLKNISQSIQIVENGESIDVETTGMIGDYMGGVVGTIWSFSGVILFFLALRLQSRELSLQIEELKSTREVFSIQQFENTFFNLIKTQNDIRQSMEYRKEDIFLDSYNLEIFKAHAVFEEVKKYMQNEKDKFIRSFKAYKKQLSKESELSEKNKLELKQQFFQYYSISFDDISNKKELRSKVFYKLAFNKFNNQLGHYFRNLYHILLYLKETEEVEIGQLQLDGLKGDKIDFSINGNNLELDRIERKYKRYADFIQAQMSQQELFLLFYNALFFKKMKKLVQYYGIIENLNREDLLYPDIDSKHYSKFIDGIEIIQGSVLKSRNEILEI